MTSTCISSESRQKRERKKWEHAIHCAAKNHSFFMLFTPIIAVPLAALLAVALLAVIISVPIYLVLN